MPLPTLLERISVSLDDRYQIERELGQGGMATVFLATDRRHDRKVAIKVLHPELSAVIGAERFEKEVKLTASLQHPHILALFDSGVADGLVYYVMPFVDGETLRGKLDRERQLSVTEAVRLSTEIAGALQYAHERGVVHRDIKPENVLLQNGHAIVADFGIALAVQQAGGSRMTQTGMSLGTPHYMAPEQAMGERSVDARADVYALGAVTYEMLAGEPPFTGPTAQSIVAKVMTERPRSLRAMRDTVPVAVELAVATALEKLPADRQESAKKFAEELQRTDASPVHNAGLTATAAAGARNTSQKLAAFTAIGVAAGVAVGALIFNRQKLDAVSDSTPIRFEVMPPDSVTLRLVCCGQMFTMPSDGRLLVYQGTPSEWVDPKVSVADYQLYLHDLTDMSTRVLPGTKNARELFFSPDNSEIAFSVGTELKRMRLSGGQPQSIATLPNGFNSGGSWSHDTILFAVSEKMLRVPAAGGTPDVLFTADTVDMQLFAPFIVDDVLLYSLARFGQHPQVFWRSLKDIKRVHRVTEGSTPRYIASRKVLLVVKSDGALVQYPFDIAKGDTLGAGVQLATNIALRSPIESHAEYTSSETGTIVLARRQTDATRGIALADLSGALPVTTRILDAQTNFLEPTFSSDGRLMSILSRAANGDLEGTVFDIQRGTAAGIQINGVTGAIGFAGADSMIYRTKLDEIMLTAANGSGTPRRLMKIDGWQAQDFAIATNGPWVAFGGVRKETGGLADIAVAHRDSGGRVSYTIGSERWTETRPSISPDGNWIAYIAVENGLYRGYVTTFPKASGRYLVSPEAVTAMAWGRDNRTLYYAGNGKVFSSAFTASGNSAAPIFGAPKLVYERDPWGEVSIAPDGKHVAFTDRVREGVTRSLVVRANAITTNSK